DHPNVVQAADAEEFAVGAQLDVATHVEALGRGGGGQPQVARCRHAKLVAAGPEAGDPPGGVPEPAFAVGRVLDGGVFAIAERKAGAGTAAVDLGRLDVEAAKRGQ